MILYIDILKWFSNMKLSVAKGVENAQVLAEGKSQDVDLDLVTSRYNIMLCLKKWLQDSHWIFSVSSRGFSNHF